MTHREDAGNPGDEDLEYRLDPGTHVEVLSTFNKTWAAGFRVTAGLAGGYRLLRLCDGRELPTVFAEEEIRPVW